MEGRKKENALVGCCNLQLETVSASSAVGSRDRITVFL